MDYSKSATNRKHNESSETGHKRRHRSAKQVERCRKYREQQIAMIQNDREINYEQSALTQPLVSAPPFQIPCLYIPGATPVHQPIYYFCSGMIPPAHFPVNICLPTAISLKLGVLKETQENSDSANHKENSKLPCADDNRTSHNLTEILRADEKGNSADLTKIRSTNENRTRQDLIERLSADENRTIQHLIENQSADENWTSKDHVENKSTDDINDQYNNEEEYFAVDNDNYDIDDEETGVDVTILIDNSDDNDTDGIMSIYLNSSLHCVLNTPSAIEDKITEDFRYTYFTLSDLLK